MVAEFRCFVKRRRFRVVLAAVLLTLTLLIAWGLHNMSPILVSMAEARARQPAVEAMNQAIAEVMGSSVTYADLMRVTSDQQGRVAMIEANAMLMNDISSEAALAAQRNLDALADCLSDLFEDTCLILRHPESLRKTLGDYADALLHVLHRAARDNRHFVFLIVEDAPNAGN